jgi:hypothetical protein
MEIIKNLPDDIVLDIYVKYLKRYRLHNGTLIKLIDLDKYKFLEKYVHRKIKSFHYSRYSLDNEIKYTIQYTTPNYVERNRKDSQIDDDLFCVTFTIKENSLKYDINRFRLKKIQDINIQSRPPNMYHRGKYTDYDWEVLTYTYEIF